MREYKTGDQIRVTNLPKGTVWHSPRDRLDLANEDVLTLADPPTGPTTDFAMANPRITIHPIVLKFITPGRLYIIGWIPIEWVEESPLEVLPKECKCDIMVTGCVCGVFEQERKGVCNA